MVQSSFEHETGILSVGEIQSYSVGDIFLGATRRLLEPLVLFDVEHCVFMGLNQEYDLRFRHGYEAYFYDIRTESHGDFQDTGNHGGHVWPTAHIGVVPEGIEIATTSTDFIRWIAQEGVTVLANASEEILHLSWLSDELKAGRLAISEKFDTPFIVTELNVNAEDRFRDYIRANPDDNIALDHPPSAKKYL